MNINDRTIEIYYLDYVNNFLTVEKFAEHYRFSDVFARFVIDKGRIINSGIEVLEAYSNFIDRSEK